MIKVESPFAQFVGLDGLPLTGGQVFIGTVGQNPELSPISVFWDDAGTTPAAQPLSTLNGLISRNGTPSRVFVDGVDFSITVRDSKGRLVFNASDATSLADASKLNFIQSGAGAVVRDTQSKLRDIVNVKDFGAKVDGATDDTAAYQAALNAALTVEIPAGTLIHGNVTVPANRTIVGVGRSASILKIKSGTNADGHSITNANDVEFTKLTIDGNSAGNLTAGNGILASGTSSRIRVADARVTNCRSAGVAATAGTSFIELWDSRVDNNLFDGFQCTTVDSPSLMFCTLESNGRYGAVYGSGCTNLREAGNRFKSNAQGGSVMVGGNDAVRLGNLADSNGTGHGLQYNGVTRGLYVGNLSKGNGISGLDFTLTAQYGVALGNITYANTKRGIEVDSTSHYAAVIGNQAYNNGEYGITGYRSASVVYMGNQILSNSQNSANTFSGLYICDDGTGLSSNSIVVGNNCSEDSGSPKQKYGIEITGTPSNTLLDCNKMTGNVSGQLSAVGGSILRLRDNNGYVSQAEGGGNIPSGSTSVVINHGLSGTPNPEAITITLTNAPTLTPGEFYIDTITSTQMTVHCRNDPSTGGANFRWRASLY